MQCRKNNQISNIFFLPPRGKPLLEEEKTHSNGKLNSILHWFTSIHKTHSIFRSDGGNSPDGGLLTILVAPSRIAGKCLQVVPHFAVNGVRCRYAEKRYISSSHFHSSRRRFPLNLFLSRDETMATSAGGCFDRKSIDRVLLSIFTAKNRIGDDSSWRTRKGKDVLY